VRAPRRSKLAIGLLAVSIRAGLADRLPPDYLTDRLGANLDGMLAEYAVLSEEAVVHVPSHLSFEEAASLPCAAVTAWVALTGHRRVTAGDTVLTQGFGGVSGTGLHPLLLTGRGITLGSISVGSRTDFEAMNRAIAMHGLHPVIDRTFLFAEARAAYRHFEGRGHFGKVVITHG
jgi:NADPH:quinone reductase-like Zn-dependent oxidoreductase